LKKEKEKKSKEKTKPRKKTLRNEKREEDLKTN